MSGPLVESAAPRAFPLVFRPVRRSWPERILGWFVWGLCTVLAVAAPLIAGAAATRTILPADSLRGGIVCGFALLTVPVLVTTVWAAHNSTKRIHAFGWGLFGLLFAGGGAWLRHQWGAELGAADLATFAVPFAAAVWGGQAQWARSASKDTGRILVYGTPGGNVAGARHAFGDRAELGARGERTLAGHVSGLVGGDVNVRVAHGIRFNPAGRGFSDVDHAVFKGDRLLLVDAKLWRGGTYTWGRQPGEVHRDGDTFAGGDVKLSAASRCWRAATKGHVQVRTVVCVTGRGPYRLPNGPDRHGLLLVDLAGLEEHVRWVMDADPYTDLRLVRVVYDALLSTQPNDAPAVTD